MENGDIIMLDITMQPIIQDDFSQNLLFLFVPKVEWLLMKKLLLEPKQALL
jgi:hypothetical protein